MNALEAILSTIAKTHPETADALRSDSANSSPTWLEDGNTVREQLEKGWYRNHTGENSPAKAILNAAKKASEEYENSQVQDACNHIAQTMAQPLKTQLDQFAAEHGPAPADTGEIHRRHNPWHELALPLQQQFQTLVEENTESLADSLAYRSEQSTASALEALIHTTHDLRVLQAHPEFNRERTLTHILSQLHPSLARGLAQTAENPVSNPRPSWTNPLTSTEILQTVIHACHQAADGLSETHRTHTIACVSNILIDETEATTGALYLTYADAQTPVYHGCHLPAQEQLATMLQITAEHLMSWTQQVSLNTEQAIHEQNLSALQKAIVRAAEVRDQATTALIHGAVPSLQPMGDIEEPQTTQQQQQELDRLQAERINIMLSELKEKQNQSDDAADAFHQYLWNLTYADQAALDAAVRAGQTPATSPA